MQNVCGRSVKQCANILRNQGNLSYINSNLSNLDRNCLKKCDYCNKINKKLLKASKKSCLFYEDYATPWYVYQKYGYIDNPHISMPQHKHLGEKCYKTDCFKAISPEFLELLKEHEDNLSKQKTVLTVPKYLELCQTEPPCEKVTYRPSYGYKDTAQMTSAPPTKAFYNIQSDCLKKNFKNSYSGIAAHGYKNETKEETKEKPKKRKFIKTHPQIHELSDDSKECIYQDSYIYAEMEPRNPWKYKQEYIDLKIKRRGNYPEYTDSFYASNTPRVHKIDRLKPTKPKKQFKNDYAPINPRLKKVYLSEKKLRELEYLESLKWSPKKRKLSNRETSPRIHKLNVPEKKDYWNTIPKFQRRKEPITRTKTKRGRPIVPRNHGHIYANWVCD